MKIKVAIPLTQGCGIQKRISSFAAYRFRGDWWNEVAELSSFSFFHCCPYGKCGTNLTFESRMS